MYMEKPEVVLGEQSQSTCPSFEARFLSSSVLRSQTFCHIYATLTKIMAKRSNSLRKLKLMSLVSFVTYIYTLQNVKCIARFETGLRGTSLIETKKSPQVFC